MATVTDQTLQLSHSPTNRLLELRDMASLDPRMQELFENLRRAAPFSKFKLGPIHIRGKRGPAREILARHIHRLSPRASGPFVAFDCAALSGQALLSQLFGHDRGDYPGFPDDVRGAITEARGGTLFLDNLEALRMDVQAFLLGALEHGKLRVVAVGEQPDVDVRLVSATEPDLFAKAGWGERFYPGLYYFACAVHLDLPPLRSPGARRDRPADGA